MKLSLPMPKIFQAGSKELVGLDISSSAVKLVELSRAGDGYRLDAYASEPLPPNAVADHQVKDPELVAQSITRALRKAGTRTRQAAVAIPGSAAITKIIEMSSTLSDDEMEQQVRFEADQHIPESIDDVNLDFQVIGPSTRNADQVQVLLAACKSEMVEMRVAAVEMAGLRASVVDVETYALQNACMLLTHQMPDSGSNKTVVLVDLGAAGTQVNVLHNLETVYTRDLSFGGRQLTEDVMRHFSLDADAAEQAKRDGSLPAEYGNEVLPAFLEDVAQQISRTLQLYFSSAAAHATVDQILLGGGCGALPGIAETVQNQLQIPAAVAQPFADMRMPMLARREHLGGVAPSLLLAAGLALRAFDP